mmetsp:Transcript_57494/g.186761  ORF Transcript_57494/g.186761 Transcript_57494/m.186761 type:complete len:586 (-) Transcript_57494:20-1777(-)
MMASSQPAGAQAPPLSSKQAAAKDALRSLVYEVQRARPDRLSREIHFGGLLSAIELYTGTDKKDTFKIIRKLVGGESPADAFRFHCADLVMLGPVPPKGSRRAAGEETPGVASALSAKQTAAVERLRNAVFDVQAAHPDICAGEVTFAWLLRAVERHAGINKNAFIVTAKQLGISSPADAFRIHCADLVTIGFGGSKRGRDPNPVAAADGGQPEKRLRTGGVDDESQLESFVEDEGELPYPWVKVEGDDGPYFFNELNGETRHDASELLAKEEPTDDDAGTDLAEPGDDNDGAGVDLGDLEEVPGDGSDDADDDDDRELPDSVEDEAEGSPDKYVETLIDKKWFKTGDIFRVHSLSRPGVSLLVEAGRHGQVSLSPLQLRFEGTVWRYTMRRPGDGSVFEGGAAIAYTSGKGPKGKEGGKGGGKYDCKAGGKDVGKKGSWKGDTGFKGGGAGRDKYAGTGKYVELLIDRKNWRAGAIFEVCGESNSGSSIKTITHDPDAPARGTTLLKNDEGVRWRRLPADHPRIPARAAPGETSAHWQRPAGPAAARPKPSCAPHLAAPRTPPRALHLWTGAVGGRPINIFGSR